MAPRTTFVELEDGLKQVPRMLDEMFADTGKLGTIPCTASGATTIALTPIAGAYAPTITAYADGLTFSFVATGSPSGNVTINVSGAGAKNLYGQSGTTQIGTGGLASVSYYEVAYSSALNSGAGGFYLVGSSSGLSMVSETATIALNVTPTPATTIQGLVVTQTGPASGSQVGPVIYNFIDVTTRSEVAIDPLEPSPDPSDLITSKSARAFEVRMTTGGTSVEGFQFASVIQLLHTLGPSGIHLADFGALVTGIFSDQDSTGGEDPSVAGGLYSINANAYLGAGGRCYSFVGINPEMGVLAGGSCDRRHGVRIQSSFNTAHGAVEDAAIALVAIAGTGGFDGYKDLVLFSDRGEAQSIHTTGSLFRNAQTMTVAHVFNTPTMTVTGNIFDFPHVNLTGAGVLTLNTSSTAAPTVIANTKIHLAGDTGSYILFDVFGSGDGTMLTRKAKGTPALPTALQAADIIGGFSALGYGATGYSASGRAAMLASARENWTDSAQGANLDFYTTPSGSTTTALGMRLGNGSSATDGTLMVNRGLVAANIPTPQAATILHLASAAAAAVTIDAISADSTILVRRAQAGPAALASGNLIGGIAMGGYGATGYASGGRAAVLGYAHQTWTDANQGTNLDFLTTTDNASSATSRMVLYQGLVMTGGAADQGAGTITATAMWSPIHAGGTAASSTLTLESTSGAGTTDAIIFKTASQVERARFQTAGALNLGATSQTANSGVLLQINSNSGALAAPIAGTQIHIANVDGTSARTLMDSFAAAGGTTVRRTNGTNGSRTALALGDFVGVFSFIGYGTTYMSDGAFFGGRATEAFTGTASGMSIEFWTVPNTTLNAAQAVIIGNDKTITGKGGILSTHATLGVGYATGAGGAQTQGTSRTTGVTLNTITGAITLFSAAGSTTPASFTVTNSAVAATDVIKVCQKSGTDLYEIFVTAVAAGSFRITFFTTGGTTTEQPVFNFAVIKGVAS